MIQLNKVTVAVRDHLVFHELNGNFESGISYLVEGRNGVGKTTLLQLIAGKIQPKTGSVQHDFIDDSLSWDEKYNLRKKYIHYIPTHALHELVNGHELFYQQRYYTIEENPSPTIVRSYLGQHLQHLDRLQLPASFKVHHLLDLDLTRLSNGQVKKIIILHQLLDTIPKILLLDYPFEGLDAQSRMELSEFLDHLANVHHIQLIVADHEHSQLPRALSKRIVLEDTGMEITDRVAPHSYEDITRGNPMSIKKVKAPVVEMRDVTIQYGDKVIIDKLNWTIRQGERWALTGRNGSGKTTLFGMIYADHPMAYSEQVFLFGKRRGSGESIWDIKKRISYLGPEQLHFLDDHTGQLTVTEYLSTIKAISEKT